jgi:uncharacterized repeat protein (TIGR04076 family)
MPAKYKVTAKIIKQQGICNAKHKVGDTFEMGDKTPPGFCAHAYMAIFPFVMGFQYGASFPWDEEFYRTTLACPDPINPVEIELTREKIE